jgi:environmental stress-induced protein Ves
MFKQLGIISIVAALFFTPPAIANDIYIEQIGDGATITLTQDGSSNRIGSEGTPSLFKGDANVVTVDQLGSANELDILINGAAVTATVTTTGSYNIQSITCGTSITASCGSSFIKQEITGDNNTVTQTLMAASTQHSEILVSGDYNTVTHDTTGSGAHSAIITVAGGIALSFSSGFFN